MSRGLKAEAVVVAEEEFFLLVVKVHAGAFAIAPYFAMLALSFFHPLAVAVWVEFFVPDVPEVVAVDVSLVEIGADGGAAGDGAVAEYGGYFDACAAIEILVAYFAFVVAQKAFASVVEMDFAFFSCLLDEVEDPAELVVGQLEFGVLCGSTHGEYGEEAPVAESQVDEEVAELGDGVDVAGVDAGYNVPHEVGGVGQ